jgi:hypothetical protein
MVSQVALPLPFFKITVPTCVLYWKVLPANETGNTSLCKGFDMNEDSDYCDGHDLNDC